MRLAVATRRRTPPKSVADDKHKHVAEQGLQWQQAAGYAVFWEMGASGHEDDEGRVYALAGQMASAGEQLSLAHAAAVEVALWREVRAKADHDPAQEMCMRAMAEAQCLFVIGTGHALANVAVRALALDQGLRADLSKRLRRGSVSPALRPFSQDRRDWVSLNPTTCNTIRAVAQSSGVEDVMALIEAVTDFGAGESWRDLSERRGEDFHRWRLQTHGIQGVPRASPWTRSGQTRELSLAHPTYDEAEGLAEDTARTATVAMVDLALAMEAFKERWTVASGHLGGPKFRTA
jgi:hypothetical protein